MGSHQTATLSSAKVATVQRGKSAMPWRSNHTPAANTVTKKPNEPQSRTRPYLWVLNCPPSLTRWAMAASLSDIKGLVWMNKSTITALNHHRLWLT